MIYLLNSAAIFVLYLIYSAHCGPEGQIKSPGNACDKLCDPTSIDDGVSRRRNGGPSPYSQGPPEILDPARGPHYCSGHDGDCAGPSNRNGFAPRPYHWDQYPAFHKYIPQTILDSETYLSTQKGVIIGNTTYDSTFDRDTPDDIPSHLRHVQPSPSFIATDRIQINHQRENEDASGLPVNSESAQPGSNRSSPLPDGAFRFSVNLLENVHQNGVSGFGSIAPDSLNSSLSSGYAESGERIPDDIVIASSSRGRSPVLDGAAFENTYGHHVYSPHISSGIKASFPSGPPAVHVNDATTSHEVLTWPPPPGEIKDDPIERKNPVSINDLYTQTMNALTAYFDRNADPYGTRSTFSHRRNCVKWSKEDPYKYGQVVLFVASSFRKAGSAYNTKMFSLFALHKYRKDVKEYKKLVEKMPQDKRPVFEKVNLWTGDVLPSELNDKLKKRFLMGAGPASAQPNFDTRGFRITFPVVYPKPANGDAKLKPLGQKIKNISDALAEIGLD